MSGSKLSNPAAKNDLPDSPLAMTVHDLPSPGAVVQADAQRTRMGRWKMILMMLVCAYTLSLVGDYALFDIPQLPMESWLGGREVLPSVGVALGQFIRPGLVLLIQFGFVGLILQRVLRSARDRPGS